MAAKRSLPNITLSINIADYIDLEDYMPEAADMTRRDALALRASCERAIRMLTRPTPDVQEAVIALEDALAVVNAYSIREEKARA